MNQESRNMIYEVINELRLDVSKHMGSKTKAWATKLEIALQNQDKYNGYANYETWNMHLILSNNQAINEDTQSFLNKQLYNANTSETPFNTLDKYAQKHVLYAIAEDLKDYIENTYDYTIKNDNMHISLTVIDCEAWTYREYQEIDWIEIVIAFLEDQLKELGYKGE